MLLMKEPHMTRDRVGSEPTRNQETKRKTRGRKFSKWLNGHFRRIFLLVINFFLNREAVFKLIGWANSKWDFLETVFVAYPATEQHALAYVYKRHRHWMSWSPWPAGIFKQNGRWGIMMVISALESDFRDETNLGNLEDLVARTERIRELLNAKQATYAGTLPGIMIARGVISSSVEAEVTARAVMLAEKQLNQANHPVIVLGGAGFIGRRIVKKLAHEGIEVYSVDQREGHDVWPSHLQGRDTILINVTRALALADYFHLFWEGLMVLNEVYPCPDEEEMDVLTRLGVRVYHVVGLEAQITLPKLPREYAGGLPCCAGWLAKDMGVIVREMN